ncbi:phosphonate ABC transporter ATP-binding protein [cf. Phormidesmis sp. LEGE 11477]|uniref:phosphonate ABC transporter ATP-binding protein n=1 Tax=cf. Phormidesmis sp. LEGE 11477 TaxID=1828680 RepID=UPI00188118D2|nr:phosphonate ABC transporter ATP-binding protein [cf. Phormidesmis sp. LEGE 11477]MBE9061785.1 phosphonate ABC transporter ATP-binding protein [cf. Phormidesmis sp. LEGE 11477]
MTRAALRLESVSCQFGSVVALQAVSLAIAPGEKVALVGPSGAGKSTLLSLLNGSMSPSQGSVQVLGKAINQLQGSRRRKLQRQVGTVYQQHQLIENLSVIHNVNAGHLGRWPLWKALWSLVWPQQVNAARQALAQLGIADKLYARTDRLSGGQQQRVALARVLVQDPKIVLADEPVASVDPARSHDMMALLSHLGKNRTLVVSLHDVVLAQTYCDRIIGLRQGRILFDLPSAQVSAEQLTALYDLEASDLEASNLEGNDLEADLKPSDLENSAV